MTDVLALVLEAHRRLGAYANDGAPSTDIPHRLAAVRASILLEEFEEYLYAAEHKDLVGIADALGDMAYVIYGTALTYGIPLDQVIEEIHRSNMSKTRAADGGKFVKGPGYTPPDILGALRLHEEDMQ